MEEETDQLDELTKQYKDIGVFVEELIAPLYIRPVGGMARWCPKWWLHAEAVFRFNALWVAYENGYASGDPLFAANWMASYADPFMTRLMDPNGTFNGCSPERGHRMSPLCGEDVLPCEPLPDLFRD